MNHDEKKLTKKAVRTALELVKNPQQGVTRIFEAEERAREAKAEAKRWEERAESLRDMNQKISSILGVVASRILGVTEIGVLPDEAPTLTLTEDDFKAMDGMGVKLEFMDEQSAKEGKPCPVKITIVSAADEFNDMFDKEAAEFPPVIRDGLKNLFAGLGVFNVNGEPERLVPTEAGKKAANAKQKEPEGAM